MPNEREPLKLQPGSATDRILGVWSNSTYTVRRLRFPDRNEKLTISRHDRQTIGWEDLQLIKNEMLGAEAMAIQVFPRESEIINEENIYHLFFLPGFELPDFTAMVLPKA